MESTAATLTVTPNWPDNNTTDYTGWTYPIYTPPSTSQSTLYWHTYPSKIRLTLSGVEKLRAAAKKDKDVREILQKFSRLIEIEVDF